MTVGSGDLDLLRMTRALASTEACVRPSAFAMTAHVLPAARNSKSLASSSGSQTFALTGAEILADRAIVLVPSITKKPKRTKRLSGSHAPGWRGQRMLPRSS